MPTDLQSVGGGINDCDNHSNTEPFITKLVAAGHKESAQARARAKTNAQENKRAVLKDYGTQAGNPGNPGLSFSVAGCPIANMAVLNELLIYNQAGILMVDWWKHSHSMQFDFHIYLRVYT
eukprot:scaffold14717_cov26-Prasinocladus_malaysianus.AAC.1